MAQVLLPWCGIAPSDVIAHQGLVDSMERFTEILQRAAAAVPAEYFLLPLHGGDPVYRERVYCYELYHQLRHLWPADTPYRLNGEVDKRNHPYFLEGNAPKPDFLVHRPGTGINYAVVEVKTCQAMAPGIIKDVENLTRFVNEFGYERGIYLLYGGQIEAVLRSATNVAAGIPHSERIEIWIHTTPGTPAERAR